MCGIWGLLSFEALNDFIKFYASFMKIKNRGPEYSSFNLINQNLLLGFHRLAIMDVSAKGNQPFYHVREDGSCIYCVCNGEIYDYKNLIKKYNITTKSGSDCEIIIPLYEKIGVNNMMPLLGSEFALIIFDISIKGKVKMIASRDPIGVRQLYYGIDEKSICVSSEMKGLCDIYKEIHVFPPGNYMIYDDNLKFIEYYSYNYKLIQPVPSMEEIHLHIRNIFTNAVRQRLESDRPFGCLLSGGLDSSLICAVVKNLIPEKKFPVFTISFLSGTDLPYAKIVAEYLDLDHHVIEINEEEALKEIDETIYATESYDITTIRASTMQRICAKFIKNNTNIRVLLIGDNSDELFLGYLYEHYAPSAELAHEDSINLVKNVNRFDGTRADKCNAHHSIEVRLPFADYNLIDYVQSLPPSMVIPQNGLEKALLRDSFRDKKYLPDVILNRTKNAFSDAVSNKERSWYQIIQEHIEKIITDDEFLNNKDKYTHCTPFTKESYYYRKKFVEYFGDSEYVAKTIPYFWMPKFTDETSDPSARTLKVYKE